MLNIAKGLQYLHKIKLIAHKNIKPENIFIKNEEAIIG